MKDLIVSLLSKVGLQGKKIVVTLFKIKFDWTGYEHKIKNRDMDDKEPRKETDT